MCSQTGRENNSQWGKKKLRILQDSNCLHKVSFSLPSEEVAFRHTGTFISLAIFCVATDLSRTSLAGSRSCALRPRRFALGTALGLRGFVDWQDGWSWKALPTHTPLFFLYLALHLPFPGSFWDGSLSIFSFQSFVGTFYIRVFTWLVFLFIDFFLSHGCLCDLLDRTRACSMGGPCPPILLIVFPATPSLILCVLESLYYGLLTELLWRMLAVR